MGKKKKSSFIVTLVFLCAIGAAAFYLYQKFFAGTVSLKNKNYTYIFIEPNTTFEEVLDELDSGGIITDAEAFEWLAKKMQLDKNIHPGKYRINNGMNMRQIINLLKYNKEEKIKLTYNAQIHDLESFVAYTDEKLALSASDLEEVLGDENRLREDFGLDPESAFGLIVPGTYEIGWAAGADELFDLLKDMYRQRWSAARLAQAKKTGFSVTEITTLASIVQSESSIQSEQSRIAGVYINRLKKGMPLQADPTLRFANKRFDAQRFWNSDKEINSPYNTYKYKGLPPGPVCLVYPQALDATLNYIKHRYMYFCAKPELNGYSDFSVNYNEHCKYAAAYQKAMSKRGITR